MPVNSEAIGKSYPPFEYEVGKEKIGEYARAVGEESPVYFDRAAAREAGFRDVAAPPMFAVVYSAGSVAPGIFDPDVGIDFSMMVHGSQEFEWAEPVCAGDVITTVTSVKDISEKGGMGFYVFESVSTNQDGDEVVRGTWTNIVEGRVLERRAEGDAGQVPPAPLRGRVRGLQPDPHRPRTSPSRSACPRTSCTGSTRWPRWRARPWTPRGRPRSLKRLAVQFRGMGFPEQEITVSGP